MSGVILEDGVQWERCNVCAEWVRIEDLGYDPTNTHWPNGCDICLACTNKHPDIESIRPSRNWRPNYEGEQA